MKILLINGSPKGTGSNSLRLAERFVSGVRAEREKSGESVSVEALHAASLTISPCRGCFSCWRSTPGSCCIKDDMQTVIKKQTEAELIVWSFPLYYYSVPGILKNLIDRQLPMNLPFMSARRDGYGSGSHESRYDMSGTRHVVISTCGFYSAEGNYDSVTRMFDHFLGKDNYTGIFCGQGDLFRVRELAARTDEYLAAVETAGKEYAAGRISDETSRRLRAFLFPKEVFEKMADASWGVSRTSGEKEPDALIFTRQMAALYDAAAYDGSDRVLEICYTDLGVTYQIMLGKDGSRVYTDGSLTATTRIDTPFEVWAAISRGEIGGAEALAKRLYTVSGDFSLMIRWDDFFGSGSPEAESKPPQKNAEKERKPLMAAMLIPWIAFWTAVSIEPRYGSAAALAISALVPLIMHGHSLILWDRLSVAAVALLSLLVNVTGTGDAAVNLGYLIFGLFWLISCFTREPLCAAYVKYAYGGEAAFQNPIFMKTNYILAACWGVLYVLIAVWTFFLKRAGCGSLTLLVNNAATIAMGIFTVWFEKWYPAHLARSGKK